MTSPAKIGLAFGGIIVATLCMIFAYHLWKRYRKRRKQQQQEAQWSTVIVNSPLRAVAMLTSRSISAQQPTANMLYQPQHSRTASADTAVEMASASSGQMPATVPFVAGPVDGTSSGSRKAPSSAGRKVQFVADIADDDAASAASVPPTGGRSFALRAVQARGDDAPVAVSSVSVRRLRTDSEPEAGGGDTW